MCDVFGRCSDSMYVVVVRISESNGYLKSMG